MAARTFVCFEDKHTASPVLDLISWTMNLSRGVRDFLTQTCSMPLEVSRETTTGAFETERVLSHDIGVRQVVRRITVFVVPPATVQCHLVAQRAQSRLSGPPGRR